MTDLVFISYSNADKGVADAICAELEGAGIRCWIAPRDITPGRMWGEAIIDGIDSSRVMILVHSRHANRSQQVVREIERAVDRRLLLLPVRLQDIKLKGALEFYLSSSQWLNAFPGPVDGYLASLPGLVRTLLEEAVETGEHTADHTAEHTAEQTAERTAEYAAEPTAEKTILPPSVKRPPLPVERPPDEAARPEGSSQPTRMSRRKIVSVAAAFGTVFLASAWAITQMNRDKNAPILPANPPINSGIDTGRDSVAKDAKLTKEDSLVTAAKHDPVARVAKAVKDPIVPVLRIAPAWTVHRIGESFSLRIETNSALSPRWRSGDSSIIRVAPGDSVFHPIATGSTYLFVENAQLRDSVRMRVIGKAQTVPDSTKENSGSRVTPDRTPTREVVPSMLTDSMARSKSSDCMQAIERADAAWLRAHYGSQLTVEDAANLKSLESIFRKRGYRASILERAKFAGSTVTFLMRLDYAGGFGPQLSVNVPFEVRMANGQPQGELESCRVRGALRSP